jgi:protein gp37
MNLQIGNKGINWTDATWNPITGCRHGCPYCYARGFAERFGRSFEPEFHPARLSEPMRVKRPLKVFCGSNADNFGDWVPREWMDQVFSVVRQCPQHTFQFLTKAPHNLAQYDWPENTWAGATANNQAMMDWALMCLAECNAPVKYVSAEPLLGPITGDLSVLDWLIIGAQTGRDAQQPKREWVMDLIAAARESNVRIWFKENLDWPYRINEWPLGQAQAQPRQLVQGILLG